MEDLKKFIHVGTKVYLHRNNGEQEYPYSEAYNVTKIEGDKAVIMDDTGGLKFAKLSQLEPTGDCSCLPCELKQRGNIHFEQEVEDMSVSRALSKMLDYIKQNEETSFYETFGEYFDYDKAGVYMSEQWEYMQEIADKHPEIKGHIYYAACLVEMSDFLEQLYWDE